MLLLFFNGYEDTITPRIAAYLAKFTSQYQFSTRLLAWAAANVQLFEDARLCLESFPENFSLEGAVGPQLDILGTIVGQSRTVAFQPSNGVSPVLDDPTYRLLLTARILQNHWNGKLTGLRTIWNQLYPGGLLFISDHQNMTVDLYVAGPATSIEQDLVLQGYILPRPQAVQYIISLAVLPILGFDLDTGFIAGFDKGHWA